MPLNMTKIAFRCDAVPELAKRLRQRHAAEGRLYLTTRYRPKRHEEMIGGSLYWIIAHRIMARSQILGFADAPDGRTEIEISPDLIPVESLPKRAHQGWRYLEDKDAPADLPFGQEALAEMPPKMVKELTILGLV